MKKENKSSSMKYSKGRLSPERTWNYIKGSALLKTYNCYLSLMFLFILIKVKY